jgi:hypothetical protein
MLIALEFGFASWGSQNSMHIILEDGISSSDGGNYWTIVQGGLKRCWAI